VLKSWNIPRAYGTQWEVSNEEHSTDRKGRCPEDGSLGVYSKKSTGITAQDGGDQISKRSGSFYLINKHRGETMTTKKKYTKDSKFCDSE